MNGRTFLFFALIGAASYRVQAQTVYAQDRVYAANQISNTVSVIDPATQKLLGEIPLGKPQPDILSALYKGQALVHGLGYSPRRKMLTVVSIGSNSVTLISTQDNRILKTIYVGRAPHEATFTPDGNQIWVSVRGEAYLSVIDATQLKEIGRIAVSDGPGMVAFSPDGKTAYVCSSFTPQLDIIDRSTQKRIKSLPVVSPFSPNIFASPDGNWVAFTHKDVGKTTVLNARTRQIEKVLPSGPISNHVTFTVLNNDPLMLVTVGGENKLKVYRINQGFALTDSVSTGSLPHGVWPTGDGRQVYVGLENDDAVQAIDLQTMAVLKTIPIGQCPQALLYATKATTLASPSVTGLVPLGDKSHSQVIAMTPVAGGLAKGSVVVRSIGLTDLALQTFTHLLPNTTYTLALTRSAQAPYRSDTPINEFKTDEKGMFTGQSTGSIKTMVRPEKPADYRYVVLFSGGQAVLIGR
ncbi:YVTN family beta-propeller protein [Spirosoma oryzae]|uniref:YVTN family beta-propeller protein n=1 Tax=Spirosoma oryzae TaxID=1469603 RepID=A0A2T0SNJ5_9BACT|nr:YncE family protein [Spirosoma oryzae]PRY34975.1 YVTN family beta-propeller protein [Spirosoma oryzae]